jgi:hypothetical protein
MDEANVKQTKKNNLVCKVLNNLEEVNIVTVIDVLLDILSNCVRDQIDNQNKIISQTYLDAYFSPNEFCMELREKPICGEDKPATPTTAAELAALEDKTKRYQQRDNCHGTDKKVKTPRKLPETMYQYILDKLDDRRYDLDCGIQDDKEKFTFDPTLSSKYPAEYSSVLKFMFNECYDNDKLNVGKLIYYLKMFDTDIKKILKSAMKALGTMVQIFPIFNNEISVLLSKSYPLKMDQTNELEMYEKIGSLFGIRVDMENITENIEKFGAIKQIESLQNMFRGLVQYVDDPDDEKVQEIIDSNGLADPRCRGKFGKANSSQMTVPELNKLLDHCGIEYKPTGKDKKVNRADLCTIYKKK